MGLYKEIKQLEEELFELLTKAFEFSKFKRYNKLKICLDVIEELEADYSSLTKQRFLNQNSINELKTELSKHGYNNEKFKAATKSKTKK